MKKNDYFWWINRIKYSFLFYDILRLDYFRGFVFYWVICYGEKIVINGKWEKGFRY